MGSVSVVMIAVAGLYWPGETQLNMMRMNIANINRFNDSNKSLTIAVIAMVEKLALAPTIKSINKSPKY